MRIGEKEEHSFQLALSEKVGQEFHGICSYAGDIFILTRILLAESLFLKFKQLNIKHESISLNLMQ